MRRIPETYEKKIRNKIELKRIHQELHEENCRRLDEILSRENWIIELAVKYYGDRWHIAVDSHPDKMDIIMEKRVDNAQNGKKRKRGVFVPVKIPNNQRPVIQYDMEDNEVGRWDTIPDWVDVMGYKKYYLRKIVNACEGKETDAYGFKWKWDSEGLENKIKKMEEEWYEQFND